MSGRVFCDSIFERLIVCGHYNEHLMDLLQVIITRETFQRKLQSCFMQIHVPLRFVNKTYLDFFKFSYLYGCVPVALYRLRKEGIPYTYTNPEANTKLKDNDKIMLLIPNDLNKTKNKELFQKFKDGDKIEGEKFFEPWRRKKGEKQYIADGQDIGKLDAATDDIPYMLLKKEKV